MQRQLTRRFAATGPLLGLLALIVLPARAEEPVLYGGIEIGGKGIKGIAIPIDASGLPNLKNLQKLPHTAINNVTLAERKDDQFRPEALEEAQAAVREYYKYLTGQLQIPPERIWIVASSGLAAEGRPKNFDALRHAVAEATEYALELQEVDQATEAELSILGSIPRDEWNHAVLMDIGSANTKGGYFEPHSGSNVGKVVVVNSKIDGTVTFTATIQAEMKRRGLRDFADFGKVATELRKPLFDKIRDSEIGSRPGLANRRKVYLSGGGPFVFASLIDPEAALNDETCIRFDFDRLRQFQKTLKETGEIPLPDLTSLPEDRRQAAQDQVDTALNIFTPENLVASSEILFGLDEAFRWEKDGKEIYFTKSGVVAWIVGFVGRAQKP